MLSPPGQAMMEPALTVHERRNIENGPWFAKLSPQLQQDILARARVRRLRDGEPLTARGAPAAEWIPFGRRTCPSTVPWQVAASGGGGGEPASEAGGLRKPTASITSCTKAKPDPGFSRSPAFTTDPSV